MPEFDGSTSPETPSFDASFDSAEGMLDVSGCCLIRLPFAIPHPELVQGFDGSLNRFSKVPEDLAACLSLRRLMLMSNELVVLPGWLECFGQLECLDLCCNPLRVISRRLCKLTQLKRILIGGGCLESVPSQWETLCCLEHLMLGNELHALPEGVGECSNLRQLTLSYNQLTCLPQSLGWLSRLGELFVDHNRLSALPVSLVNLAQLRYLHAHANPLRELPWFIFDMPMLRGLSLCDYLIPHAEAKRFAVKCRDSGIQLQLNRSLACSQAYQDDTEVTPVLPHY